MENSTEFDRWLRDAVLARGYDRHWVRRNLPVLRQRFQAQQPLPDCPPPPEKPRDRYAEL